MNSLGANPSGRPGYSSARPHTCRAREGPALGRGVARRCGSAPRSLAEYQALPLPGGVQTKPGGDLPEAFHPGEAVLQLP